MLLQKERRYLRNGEPTEADLAGTEPLQNSLACFIFRFLRRPQGRLIALCGVVGSGKTVTLRRLQQILKDENRVAVAKSLSVEKHSIKLATLISTLYYDLTQDKQVQIPKQSEKR